MNRVRPFAAVLIGVLSFDLACAKHPAAAPFLLHADGSVECRQCPEPKLFRPFNRRSGGSTLTAKWDGAWVHVSRSFLGQALLLSPDHRTLLLQQSLRDTLLSPPRAGQDSSRY
jgi:hypothetical protein